jgi:hypothetical protein
LDFDEQSLRARRSDAKSRKASGRRHGRLGSPPAATGGIVDDVVSLDRAVVFSASKDRPVLFTALAWSDDLLTLDREDFAKFLGAEFYGLRVRLPFDFLDEERAAGRLKISRP